MPSRSRPADAPGTAPSRAWVIGAGLAGLSAAIRLTQQGWQVTVLEAAGQAGGRCRSYDDKQLGRRIDNGNHLLLSGNRSAFAFLETVGATESVIQVAPARVPFIDLRDGTHWTLRPNAGPLPWWVASASRRVPGTGLMNYVAALKMARAGNRTVAELFAGDEGSARQVLYDRFWEPMAVAVLNTEADQGAARLLWPVMTEILMRGEAAFRPCIAREGLSESFVDPALRWLAAHGADIRFGQRVRSVALEDEKAAGLALVDETVPVATDEAVVIAVTPAVCRDLLPDVTVPEDYRPIVNIHFAIDAPVPLPQDLPLVGLIGGTAQWLFQRDGILSVTISAGVAEAGWPQETVAETVWCDICKALGLSMDRPKHRVVTEKRATIAQTPAQDARRPGAKTPWRNIVLAGDWTDTGLPATIEGAIRSGEIAAEAVGPASRLPSS